jgi:hypothetical protein
MQLYIASHARYHTYTRRGAHAVVSIKLLTAAAVARWRMRQPECLMPALAVEVHGG